MHYIERVPITDATFLAGSIGEPAAGETAWAPGVHAVDSEVVRPALHRVFKCAVARVATDTKPPEQDGTAWKDIRATKRWVPFGPLRRADGQMVYQNHALTSTTEDLVFVLQLRYANSIALFGLGGASWSVEVFPNVLATEPVKLVEGRMKAPATGYWDYAFGRRRVRDRVLITDLPIFPAAKVVIKIKASEGQERRVTHIEPGNLRFLPGAHWGGVAKGLRRSPRAFSFRKDETDGSSTTFLYGSTYDLSGRIEFDAAAEDQVLVQLRELLGNGVVFVPVLADGFEQSMVFGTLESADTDREQVKESSTSFQVRGFPV